MTNLENVIEQKFVTQQIQCVSLPHVTIGTQSASVSLSAEVRGVCGS